ncbi:tellurite resistance TerB family protein [Elioraea rosea]|uniref:tellurite resistance TerB family protein n=1 Tax=Elioraea rosea TaxID=2492390 RepID=UPI0011869BFC|nr:DUF533 domain-containing protein [Elioraea rosea]
MKPHPRCFDPMVEKVAAEARHVLPVNHGQGHDGTITPHGPAATDHALALMRAMIAAAKSDGQITDDERERLLDRIGCAEFDPDVQDWLQREFRSPLDVSAVAAGAEGSHRRAVELYIASVLAVDLDAEAEFAWLAELAGALGLEAGIITAIHAKLGVPAPRG